MGEALVARYWCHMCSQMVSPVMGAEIKCPFCDSGFVEEMDGSAGDIDTSELTSGRSLSLWAPILLGMIGGGGGGISRRRRHRRDEEQDNPNQDRDPVPSILHSHRNSAIFRLIQELEDGLRNESDRGGDSERERDQESLILIDSFNRALILQGALSNQTNSQDSENTIAGASLGDYFLGPGLDLLLQHLAENDPNRYGTPPARKDFVAAMPTVKVVENLSCSVCLEEFLVGGKAKEMPCKHLFHGDCIIPWLELHSSCPVCRFQMPADESKDLSSFRSDPGLDTGSGSRVPWPFYELFSPASSSSSNSGGNDEADEN